MPTEEEKKAAAALEHMMKPHNVTESDADSYLNCCGWGRKVVGDGVRFIHPFQGREYKRGAAIVEQFRGDVNRMLFVLGHGSPELVSTLFGMAVKHFQGAFVEHMKEEIRRSMGDMTAVPAKKTDGGGEA